MSRLELRQNLKQKLSPQQIQFMKLLQVSNANIESEIKKELEENPALEEIENNEKETIENIEEYSYKTSQKTNRNSYDFNNLLSQNQNQNLEEKFDGKTLLMIAVENDQSYELTKLLENGANTEVQFKK